ncbi:aldo/keto reductase [Shigella flexneri]
MIRGSLLARGRLTRPWQKLPHDWCLMRWGKISIKVSDDQNAQIAERLKGVSEEPGATRAQLCWPCLSSKPGIAAPIIGTSREEQLDELLNAVDITLKRADCRTGSAV